MSLVFLDRMWERVATAREESDTSLFFTLLYFAEMVTKTVTASMVAAVGEDRERHRYLQLHRLVRADGLGDWSLALEDVLTGPASQNLVQEARVEQRELTQRLGSGSWQYEALAHLYDCAKILNPRTEDLPSKIDGRKWFSTFVVIRNMTRGHGAPTTNRCSKACVPLEQSLRIVIDNFSLFQRSWAYLYRNLSGKYRVTKLAQDATPFEHLKSTKFVNIADGVYVHLGEHVRVDLIESDVDASDFYFPNGAFNDQRFELISYITDNRRHGDASPYMAPPMELPPSETHGLGLLDVQGECFANLPPDPRGYIHRQTLETELYNQLTEERHPVITLAGRGGIGKTWLAVTVLHELTKSKRFTAILWFSARDIDLLPQGPKIVRPRVLTTQEIAKEFVRLMQPAGAEEKGFDTLGYLVAQLSSSAVGPLLFVFDNFETMRNPADVFVQIDNSIRPPNKVLITTRTHGFKGDYPVEVYGMTEEESEELIDRTAAELGVRALLTKDYRREVYRESDGHPYVIKILLGEVAKAGRLVKVERIVATKEQILEALFERTYASLSPVAKRVFLTLSNWRSTVPQLAVEAVLLRPENERMDVVSAIEELDRSSFVEVTNSVEDDALFLTLPLVAQVFGRQKLAVSPLKSAIDADTELLQAFGAAQQSDVRHGIGPRIERVFRNVAVKISSGGAKIDDYLFILEFVASKYARGWLLLSALYEEVGGQEDLEKARDAVRLYLEATGGFGGEYAWARLARLCSRTGDALGEAHALIEMAHAPGIPFNSIATAAHRVNALLRQQQNLGLNEDEKKTTIRRLVAAMEARIDDEGAPGDYGNLAWLLIHLGDRESAKRFTYIGLAKQPDNFHLLRLSTILARD